MSRDLREVLHSGYSFVRGVESNQAAAAITLDHVIDAQIKSMKSGETTAILDAQGESVGNRASKYDQLDALLKDIQAVAQAVQAAGDDPQKLAALGIDDTNLPSDPSGDS